MLSGDKNSVNPDWDHRAIVVTVLNGHLGLTVRPEPWASVVLSHFSKLGTELSCKNMGKRHKLRCLIGSITEHMTLVTSTDLLRLLCKMSVHTLSNVGTLLLDVDQHLAVVGIKTDISRCESNFSASVTDYLLVVNISLGGDLTENHDHVGLGAGLAGDLAIDILF
ncbi:hypothetical protein HanHA300_Chr07g0248441 [Helianthus annuus]|nr:hypothetical protein HanHA300_Chr07g0248441 [Helianthus annuus]KAJ0563629.1 hypothetical protein HanHA89_Chr07g0265251 [Helianthus annuus]KAJ0731716.1 hypothetical protein HanOQP8_Chr07g0255111 [Helianthus annuus]